MRLIRRQSAPATVREEWHTTVTAICVYFGRSTAEAIRVVRAGGYRALADWLATSALGEAQRDIVVALRTEDARAIDNVLHKTLRNEMSRAHLGQPQDVSSISRQAAPDTS